MVGVQPFAIIRQGKCTLFDYRKGKGVQLCAMHDASSGAGDWGRETTLCAETTHKHKFSSSGWKLYFSSGVLCIPRR